MDGPKILHQITDIDWYKASIGPEVEVNICEGNI